MKIELKRFDMQRYYISRGLLSLVFGVLVALISTSIWTGALSALFVFFTFIFLSRSGRYRRYPERGVSALQRDEWTQSINDKAGRNAWVVVAVAGSALILYYGWISPGDVPIFFLGLLLFSGMVTYYGSDFWMRRL
jgi:hypothetical protein